MEGPCAVESSVNMASLMYAGEPSPYTVLHIGGIASYFTPQVDYDASIKNCANYGDVTHTGPCSDVYIGGISSYTFGAQVTVTVQNTANYGAITVTERGSSQAEYLTIGGIIGGSYSYIG